ncbi:MAG: ATP-binding protein [Phaeodactylibacter sp.]|nr:ATP-binding protein [Phaeodactylibacter sp.]
MKIRKEKNYNFGIKNTIFVTKMELYIPRFLDLPKQNCFLFGPRGTGKTTFLHNHLPDALWLDLLKPENYRQYKAHPERLEELTLGNPQKKDVVIAEIQRVPELLPLVHSIIEKKRGHRFILTGSSARKLKSTGIDLLGGRAIRKTMHPFMLSELPAPLTLTEALQFGLLPIVYQSADKKATLNAYASLYIQQEVFQESLTRNIGDFSRFLEAISLSHAAVLNVSNVARDCSVERKTVDNYIQILEDILLAFRLPVFTKRASRAMSSHPKFYFFDAGVFQALRPRGPLDKPEEIGGAALEGLLAQHLRAWIAYSPDPFTLYFWRSQRGVEVDFILYGEEGLYAIEVKNSNSIRPKDLRGLNEFGKDYPISRRILLYRGSERLMKNGILCLPCEEFLAGLSPSKRMGVFFD